MRKGWNLGMVAVLVVSLMTVPAGACAQEPEEAAQLEIGELHLETREVQSQHGTDVTADYGRLAVPENRDSQRSRAIEIAFVRLRALGNGQARPVFYLSGGPGDAAVWQAEDPHALEDWLPMLALGDVVLVDQRGAGRSTPSLRWRTPELPSMEVYSDQALLEEHMADMTRRARADLESGRADLAGYTTVESARDIDAVRDVLGYERLAILGFSYGTHLGLAYARAFPDHLDAMILSNIEGPDHTLKLPDDLTTQFRRLAMAVEQDPTMSAQIPDFMELLNRVRSRLDREPMVVRIMAPDENEYDVPVGRFFFDMVLRIDVGDASDLPVFPRLLYTMDQGDPTLLRWFVQRRAGVAIGVNAMHEVMNAASGASRGRQALIDFQANHSPFGNISNFPPPEVTDLWDAPDLGDAYRSPLVSDVPTLVLSGEWDWNTPPYQAEQIRWGLLNSVHLHVKGAGHEQVLPHPEIRKAMVDFLEGKDVRGVSAAWPPLRFVPLEGYDPELTHPSVPRP